MAPSVSPRRTTCTAPLDVAADALPYRSMPGSGTSRINPSTAVVGMRTTCPAESRPLRDVLSPGLNCRSCASDTSSRLASAAGVVLLPFTVTVR